MTGVAINKCVVHSCVADNTSTSTVPPLVGTGTGPEPRYYLGGQWQDGEEDGFQSRVRIMDLYKSTSARPSR